LSEKQKQQKEVLGVAHGRATGGTGRANLSGGLLSLICLRHGVCFEGTSCAWYFCTRSSCFWPESTPNLISFAPRLNL